MNERIDDYINFVKFEKHLSNNTIMSYQNDLQKYILFLEDHHIYKIENIKKKDIEEYLKVLSHKEYSITSIARKLTTIKNFHNYLYQRQLIKVNVAESIERPKLRKTLPKVMSVEQVDKLLDISCNRVFDYRNNAMLELLYGTGVRISELLNLKLSDIDIENCVIRCIGKGNKERTGYINEMTKKAIEEYLRIRDNFNPKTKTLFVSKYGSKMSSTAIEKIIKKAYKLAEINDENYCVHTLRHTCATLLYRNGTDIRTIQELLGHVQIDTTEIYTHLHDQEVMDAMLDHPLSQYNIANAEAFCA